MAVRLKKQELEAKEGCLLLMMKMMKKKMYQEILGRRWWLLDALCELASSLALSLICWNCVWCVGA